MCSRLFRRTYTNPHVSGLWDARRAGDESAKPTPPSKQPRDRDEDQSRAPGGIHYDPGLSTSFETQQEEAEYYTNRFLGRLSKAEVSPEIRAQMTTEVYDRLTHPMHDGFVSSCLTKIIWPLINEKAINQDMGSHRPRGRQRRSRTQWSI